MSRVVGRFILMTVIVVITFAATDASQSDVRVLASSNCPSNHCRYLPFIERAKPVAVSGLTWTSFRDGSFGAVGTVKNTTGNQSVYDVVVEVDFYVGGSILPYTQFVTTTLAATLPGQLNPFVTGIPMGNTGVYNVKASIKNYNLTSSANIVSQTLAFAPQSGSTNWTTTVINTTSYAVTDVTVVFWIPAASNCRAIYTYNLPGILEPGQTRTFIPSICGGSRPWITPSGEVFAAAQAVVVP